MGAKFNRQDVVLGALPVGVPAQEDALDEIASPHELPNEPFDWDVLPPGTTGQVLTVNADTSIGWATPPTGFTNPMTTAGDTIYGGTAGAATRLAIGTAGQVLTVNSGATGTTWTTVGGTGTVTSVSWTGDGTIFTASADTPVTNSGTLAPSSLIAQTKNTVLAGPTTGSNAAPTFRALAAADVPNLPASQITSGQLAIAQGGTGQGTAAAGFNALSPMTTAGDVIIGGTSGAGTRLGIGSTNQVLTVVSGAPAWAAASGGGMSVGGAVGSPVNNAILYINSSGNLAASSSNTAGTNSLSIGAGGIASTGGMLAPSFSAYSYGHDCVLAGNNGGGVTIQAFAAQATPALKLQSPSSTSVERSCGQIDVSFNTSTDASWTGNLLLYAGDYTSSNAGKRLGIQIQSNGSAALVGFFGATPVVQQTGDVLTALTNLGLVSSPTISASDLPTTGLTITQWTSAVSAATVTSNACTCDASVAEKWTVALGSGVATTITLANIGVGQTLEITTFQPASGSAGTITWAGQTVRWSGGTAGAATATLSKGDTFVFTCRSTGIIAGSVALANF